jgi:O-methyltransferase involved in polyketide biosynthesis
MDQHKLKPDLSGISETMLWTLYNRASEAERKDGILKDPDALRIYRGLAYDFERSFGSPEPSHAVRAVMFDAELRRFIKKHPDGVIVNLGEGLETQCYRIKSEQALWLSVDLPEAIHLRAHFIGEDSHHRHLPLSVLNRAWFDEVPKDRPVYITAQGLLMYLPEMEVRLLFRDLARYFSGAWFTFDTIPSWFSRKTLESGWRMTPHYVTPVMPWGINRHQILATLKSWTPMIEELAELKWWRFPRGIHRWVFPIVHGIPYLNRYIPAVTRVRFASTSSQCKITSEMPVMGDETRLA